VSQRYEDAITTLFNRPGTIGTLSADGFVSARVWTAGTYGQAIPFAVPSDQRDQHILHVENSSAYRTNIGLLTDVDSTVRVTLFDGDGVPLEVDERRVPALEVIQFPVQQPVTNGYVLVEALEGRVYAYGSLVDNRTGDPTFIPAQ
jgi:hypothetical protein